MAEPDHITTPAKSPSFQFYANDFTSGTVDLSTEDVGAYIRLLCYQWEKGAIPADMTAQGRIAGLTTLRMRGTWGRIKRHFSDAPDGGFVNRRLERVRQGMLAYRKKQSDKGKASAANRKPTEPQPSLNHSSIPVGPRLQPEGNSSSSSSVFNLRSSEKRTAAVPNARSGHPVYTSDRFAVFEWQFDELSKMLGGHFEAFDISAFFDALTQQSRTDGLVIPKAEAWAWLQAEVLAEAKRRGLPMASAVPVRDKAAEQRIQDERILAQIQEDRRLRAGR